MTPSSPDRADQLIVPVDLGDRSYEIAIGPGLLRDAGKLIGAHLPRKKTAIVTDRNVAEAHLADLLASLEAEQIEAAVLQLPAGESTKSQAHLFEVTDFLLEAGIERNDVIVAFGGGVIGDLAGYAAASLRRGVDFVQIPTSLLAQVDSSVGGKTGINSPHGKNLIGAFHQPSLVLADIDVLDTLTARDFLAGYGEVVKYGGLGSLEFFEWLELNGPALAAGDVPLRTEAVRRSVQMKADIVARDETEQGDRALLNLGHTFGHALEAATGYSDRLLHGEGVAIGCAMAFETSARMGLMSQESPSRFRAHLAAMGMKRDLADIEGALPDAEALMALMAQDKKVTAGKLRFIMARSIGEAFVTDQVDLEIVKNILTEGLKARG